jgi:surface carbohydrate biosynthesis protein
MKAEKATLLIPVEQQVRELDPKLLLACIAVRRGFSAVVGPRREMHFRIPSFPRSIYLSKSMTSASEKVFRMLRKLGHEIVVWDEEGLVHLPSETYYRRRLSPVAMGYVSHLFAWGEDNAELWRQYPELPPETPIHVTGNPRGDLLRPEMRMFYEKDVEELRRIYGNFILVNTNFNQVNAFYPSMNLLLPASKPGEEPKLSRRARGMGYSPDYAEGLYDHKLHIFEDFQRLIPTLEQAFPDYTIVVRPHPAENQEIYREIAAQCERVWVTNEGNVVPWLMATQAVIHNGCTTSVEAYVMGKPAITYRATINDDYDQAFHHLPNLLSHQCFDFEELRVTLGKILAGELGAPAGEDRKALIDYHLAALEGPLVCERMVDVLEEMMKGWSEVPPKPAIKHRLQGWIWATKRRLRKRFRGYRQDTAHNRPGFLRHRYPRISLEQVRARISRFQMVLGDSRELKVEQIFNQFFRIGE